MKHGSLILNKFLFWVVGASQIISITPGTYRCTLSAGKLTLQTPCEYWCNALCRYPKFSFQREWGTMGIYVRLWHQHLLLEASQGKRAQKWKGRWELCYACWYVCTWILKWREKGRIAVAFGAANSSTCWMNEANSSTCWMNEANRYKYSKIVLQFYRITEAPNVIWRLPVFYTHR